MAHLSLTGRGAQGRPGLNGKEIACRQPLEFLSCSCPATPTRPWPRNWPCELKVPLVTAEVGAFADGETRVHVSQDVRHANVFIVQPTCPPVNDHLMVLALLADAVRAAGAARITGIVPYFGYARQEQRSRPGEPRSAQVVGRLLGSVRLDHLVTLDLHAPALESALPMPATLLHAEEVFLPRLKSWGIRDLVVVTPDAGGLKRAQRYALALNVPLAVIAKERPRPDSASPLQVLGEVKDRACLVVDDMASTGRTLAGAADTLRPSGGEGSSRHLYPCGDGPRSGRPTLRRAVRQGADLATASRFPPTRGWRSSPLPRLWPGQCATSVARRGMIAGEPDTTRPSVSRYTKVFERRNTNMKLSDIFTRSVVTAAPEETLAAVALRMQEHNVGTVIIVEHQRPIGIVTDRDLALALGARGVSPQAQVQNADDTSCSGHSGGHEHLYRHQVHERTRSAPVADRGPRRSPGRHGDPR